MIDRMTGDPMDTTKIATLVRHWIEHNRGHRESYEEWRAKLADAGLPITIAALEKVAALTDQANEALSEALTELQDAGGGAETPAAAPVEPHAHHHHGGDG
jgi:hypothetical protein